MAQNITLLGASYSNVPAVQLPKTGGGTAKFTDTTPTTASASDVASGKIFFDASGTQRTGSASGGGGNEFLVTFTKSGQNWVPDKTFSQTFTAYTNGKTICSIASNNSSTSIVYIDDIDGFYVVIEEPFDDYNGSQYYNWGVDHYVYVWTSEGFEEDENSRYYATDSGTALPSDVASGKVFYNTTGIQIGTASGGGSSKNAQSHQSTTRATSSSYTNVNSLTCTKTGTYTVYWSTMRSSTSGTWGSQLYIGGTAYGSAHTGSWSNHVQNITVTGVQIDQGDTVDVRVRSRGSNYYGYAPLVTIIEED